MKPDISISSLIAFLAEQNIVLNPVQVNQLNKYAALLHAWKNKINLISHGDYAYLWKRHVLVSLYYGYLLKDRLKQTDHIVDMGSGAGFPGVILSIIFPDNVITLVDSSRKKALFLRKVQKTLELNIVIHNERLEFLADQLFEKADILVVRALASIPKLIGYAQPIVKADGQLLTIKGNNYREELIDFDYNTAHLVEIPIKKTWIKQSSYFDEKVFLQWKP